MCRLLFFIHLSFATIKKFIFCQFLAISCVEQVAPLNGNVVCTNDGNLESVCQFTCNTGFTRIGNDVTMCFDDEDEDAEGEWTSPPPTCQRKLTFLKNFYIDRQAWIVIKPDQPFIILAVLRRSV